VRDRKEVDGIMMMTCDLGGREYFQLKRSDDGKRIRDKGFDDAGLCGLVVRAALYIIHRPEVFIPGQPEFQGRLIGDTQQLQGVIAEALLDILIRDAIDLYLAIDSLKADGMIIIA